MRRLLSLVLFLGLCPALAAQAKDGNRLAYLDELNLYYPSHTFPKLITPQWVGEKGVDAVVILAIDDMKDPKKYEAYLRPILDRLKKIDGRAPVSLMACSVKPDDPQLQDWLKEGLSIECHTFDHPCPFFKNGFKRARETYEKCVDLMHEIPGNKPVAFRMPCCDSMNTPSPRFFAEIFNKTTEKGKFLSIDSSVFMAFTSKDPELPKDLVLDKEGKERFLEYFPKDRTFVNWIENYPYPYMIGRQCWEFPCMTPSDWQAQHRHKPFNPRTVADWKAALDCTVIKQGVFSMVFHPHGWIKAEQVVELIDYAQEKYKGRVKFLTFKEAERLLTKNLLNENALREKRFGLDHGIRLFDLNQDKILDVLIGNFNSQQSRLWKPKPRVFCDEELPAVLIANFGHWWGPGAKERPIGEAEEQPVVVGQLNEKGPFFLVATKTVNELFFEPFNKEGTWQFENGKWIKVNMKVTFFPPSILNTRPGQNRLIDLDGDDRNELFLPSLEAFFQISDSGPIKLPFSFPRMVKRDFSKGQKFTTDFYLVDLNADAKLDLIFSNEEEYGIYLFADMKTGWSKKVLAGKRGDNRELPMISKNGTNNGFWIHSGHFWWSNEDTAHLKDFVDRRAMADLLKGAEPKEVEK